MRGIDIDVIGGGREALHLFQAYLRNYKITVFDDLRGRSVLFEDPLCASEKYVDLFFHD